MPVVSGDGRSFILRFVSMVSFLASLSAASLPAGAVTTNTAASFLAVGAGSRPIALGGAYTAISDDAFALIYNPAGLSRSNAGSLAFQHNEWGFDMRQEFASMILPTGAGMLGIGLTYMSYGSIPVRDLNGNRTGTALTPTDTALAAGYGFGELWPGLTAGAVMNLYNEDLAGSGSFGMAVNLGGLYHWPQSDLDLGLTLYNVGTPMAGYALPMKAAFGAAYRFLSNTLLLTAEGEVPLSATPFQVAGGVEWTAFNLLALRAGYRAVPAEGAGGVHGLTAGLGLNLAPLTLSYAFQPLGDLAQAHRLTVEYAFSAAAPAPRPKKAGLPPKAPALQPDLQPPSPISAPRPVSLTPEEKKNAVRAFLRGQEYYDQRQYDLAIAEFEKALNIYPDYAKARRAQSWAKRDRARLLLAGSMRGGAERNTVEEAQKLYQQGLELERKGKPVDSAFAFKSALWLKPDYAEAKQGLRRVQTLARKNSPVQVLTTEDQKDGTAAGIIKSTAAAGHTAAPEEVLTNPQPRKSPKADGAEPEESLTKAIQKHFLLGNQALDQGDYSQAQREYELVLEFEPEHKQARYKLGVARTKAAEEVQETKARAKEARASGDRLGEVNALRNLVMLDPSDPSARKAFDEAKQQSKLQINELYKKGVTAYAQGNYADAIQIWNEVLDLDPEHARARESIQKARQKLELTNE